MAETNNQNTNTEGQQTQTAQQTSSPEFDYEKLASLITGKQTATEDTVLKSYFKEQGLSREEMAQAISAFKKQKAENTPDVAQLQNDLTAARGETLTAKVNQSATIEAIKQGVDINSVPYVLKMADFSGVTDDGKINADKLTEAIKKVLEDVPALKGAQKSGEGGFQKIGGDGNNNNQTTDEEVLARAFGIKK